MTPHPPAPPPTSGASAVAGALEGLAPEEAARLMAAFESLRAAAGGAERRVEGLRSKSNELERSLQVRALPHALASRDWARRGAGEEGRHRCPTPRPAPALIRP